VARSSLQPIVHAILEDYALPWHGTHGVLHWARVLENGLRLAHATGGNVEVVQLFAVFHDARRVNEGTDDGHGQRGAELAAAWKGNSAPIAARHYLQVTDADFDAALVCDANSDAQTTRNPTQQPTAHPGKLGQEATQAPGNQGLVLACSDVCNDAQTYLVPPRGVEPLFSD
jgi:hypothetical protein